MSRWTTWGVALLVLALFAVRGTAQDVKDAAKKDDAKKDAAKKDDAKKDDAKKDDPKKDDPKKPDPKAPAAPLDKKDAEKKLLKTSTIVGEIVHIEPNKQAFRIRLTYQYSELNQGAANEIINGQRELAQARNRDQYAAAMQKIARNRANLYTLKSTHKDFPVDAAEGMKVRLPLPKASFDDMGNLKKPNAKELAALRGPDKMFDGEFSDIANNQIVQVTLVLPKPQTKPVKKDDLTLKEEEKIEAIRVAVLRQPLPGK